MQLLPLCVCFAFAASVVTIRGTITNRGNVKLSGLDTKVSPQLPGSPACSLQDIGQPASNTTWVEKGVIPVGKEVVCTISYPIGQDALESTLLSANGAPEVRLVLTANATATLNSVPVVAVSAPAVVSVSQLAGIAVKIASELCQVPQEPGGLV